MRTRVDDYLEALGAMDWDRLEATLAPDVVRIGPFRDVVEGSRAYRDFLANVVPKLEGYVLAVESIDTRDDVIWVRLSETLTNDSGQRQRTEEALVFELDAARRIASVLVFTQKSEDVAS
jgi:hypothetical protein